MDALLPLDPVLFEARLRPHRSLAPRGLLILLGVAGAVSAFAAARFVYLGAWPISAIFLADLVLLWGAFKLNNWAARRFEAVELRASELLIRQVDPRGRERAIRFQPYWVRVDKPDPERTDSQLVLRSHGRAIAIGSFLPHAERLAFADTLGEALRRMRSVSP
jgi:uncharacterized membrane protein